jgi:Lrp/AsnC family transcriptional regulator for asnA, asnC and gidA
MKASVLPGVLRGPMDETDWHIVQALHEDGRMPFTEIARRIGVSEPTVRNRLNQLRRQGIVSITALVDPAAVGLLIDAKIGIRVQKRRLLDVGRELAAMDEVHYVSYVTGGCDIMAGVYQPSMDALFRFLSEKLDTLEGVSDHEIWTILRTIKTTFEGSSQA